MDAFVFNAKRLVWSTLRFIVFYFSIIVISLTTTIKPAHASGTVSIAPIDYQCDLFVINGEWPITFLRTFSGYSSFPDACNAACASVLSTIPVNWNFSVQCVNQRYGLTPHATGGSCPSNSTRSYDLTTCTCKTDYSPDPTQTSCVRNNLTITLSGGNEVEPSNSQAVPPVVNTLPFIATVIDQNTKQPPTSPVKVHISLKVDPTSGGHDHGKSDRPRGGIAELDTCPSDDVCWPSPQSTDGKGMTDGNGQVVFNFNAPEASGTHTITATCDGCSNTATRTVDVKVGDLWPIPDSVYYALTEDGSTKVIGSTTEHKGNHNHHLTNAASLKLWRLASDYYAYQIRNGVVKPTLLHLNDASLKWGGVLDVDADWVPDHIEHRRGTVVDVRANSSPGAIPAADFDAFKKMAKKFLIDPHFEGGSTNQHFHLRLFNRRE